MIDLCQDILPKDFQCFCIDCQNIKKSDICDKCLEWPRERPFWKLKGNEKTSNFKRRKLEGFKL